MKSIKILLLLLFLITLSACNRGDTYNPEINGVPPVYQGMDVLNTNPLSSEGAFLLSNTFTKQLGLIDDIPNIDIPQQDNITYFANPNEDIFVSVRLLNPSGQVILRFTLNNRIYQSFEFESGSNSELLIVKVNAGTTSGIRLLTIDEIKYIENVSNETKDAVFAGDRTIRIGVSYQNKTEALFIDENISSTSYQSVIDINDNDNMIGLYNNAPVFYLFDGNSIVYTKTLSTGRNIVNYPYIHPNKTYEYAVVSFYDLLDGTGSQAYVAIERSFLSLPLATLTFTEIAQEKARFDLDITDPNNLSQFVSYELYLNQTLISSQTNVNQKEFNNLLSDTTYEIKTNFTYNLNDGKGLQTFSFNETFKTESKSTPTVDITNIVPTQDSISFALNVTDSDQVGEITAIDLYQGDTLIESLNNITLREFNNLLSNNTYEIKVTYTYDLNDGVGNLTTTDTETFKTLTKATPTVNIINTNITQDSMSFELNVTDIDQVGEITSIELYQGDTLIETLNTLTLREFNTLLSNNTYDIKVTYTYDLNDGFGELNIISSDTVLLSEKTIPTVIFTDINPTQSSVSFQIDIIDIDQILELTSIELYQGDTSIQSLSDLNVRRFDNLLSNTIYSIHLTYTYDLNDGSGVQTVLLKNNGTQLVNDMYQFNPLAYNDAIYVMIVGNKMYAIYSVRDLSWDEAVLLSNQKGGHLMTINNNEELAIAQDLLNQTNTLSTWYGGYFENGSWRWISGEVFNVTRAHFYYPSTIDPSEGQVLSSSFDSSKYWYGDKTRTGLGAYIVEMNLGAERNDLQIKTLSKATPTVDITNIIPTQDSMSFELNVTDSDQVGEITSIELYQGDTLIDSLDDLTMRRFDNLLSNNTYQIKVTYTYDLNDGVGNLTTSDTETHATLSKAIPTLDFKIMTLFLTQESISFALNVTDIDQVGEITLIELYQGDTLIETLGNLSLRTFGDLLSNNTYQIKITYTYDLNDGVGQQTLIVSQTTTTRSKATPTVEITNIVPTQDSISFALNVTDSDQVGEITAIELYQGDTFIDSLDDLSMRRFDNLLSNNTYQIKVTYTYDLNDGVGNLTTTDIETHTTLSKVTPDVVITNIVPTQDSISFELNVTDNDQVGEITSIELYQGDTFIDSLDDLTMRRFENLLSNNTYDIKVTYTYDLNDGVGIQTIIFDKAEYPNAMTQIVDGSFSTTTELTREVQNNSFEDVTGTGFWYYYLADWGGAQATFNVVNGALEVDILNGFDQVWGVMVKQQGIQLVTDTTYRLSFTASASISRPISVYLNPGQNQAEFTLTSTPTTYTYDFLYTGADVQSRIEFLLGQNNGKVILDNIKLQVADSPSLTTLSKAIPTVEIKDIESTQESIKFNLDINDLHFAIKDIVAEIYSGNTLLESISNKNVIEFKNLQPVIAYTIKVTVIYDLNENKGTDRIDIEMDSETPGYTLSFETNSNLNIPSFTQSFENTTIAIDQPSKIGYTFDGWYLDDAFTATYDFKDSSEFAEILYKDTTVYVKWNVNSYTLSYHVFDSYDPLTNIPLNYEESIESVALGGSHSAVVTSDGRLFTWGYNFYGQLGNGTNEDTYKPVDITSYFNLLQGEFITSVYLGSNHSAAISSNGRLFTWGFNHKGQLGTAENTNINVPKDITNRLNLLADEIILEVLLGVSHSAAFTSKGNFYTWGDNQLGQTGHTNSNLPTNIVSSLNLSDNERISLITLGGSHTGVLTSSGRVFSWGWNIYGQLGNSSNIQRNTPTEITSRFKLDDEDVILKLKYGQFTSSAISKLGQVFMWGLNTNGQLGDATTTNRNLPVNISSKFSLNTGEYINDLSLGSSHSSALTSEGRLYTWGRNNHGQLGDALTSQRNVPEEITNQFNLGLNEFVEFISLDNNHSIALTNLNRVFVWGSNGNGRLGDGTTQNRSLPLELLFNAVNMFNNETINFDVTLQKPNDPIKQGYTFDGWYIDLNSFTTAYEFTTMPANNLNLFGRFKLEQYNITYDLDGGINAPNNPSTFMFNDSISLIAPTKLGYTFMGFYLDEELSERIERIDENIFRNIVLYAKWDQFVFEVRLGLDNGTYLGETVFIQEFDTPIILGTPSRLGYRFDGWLDSDLNIVDSNSIMPKQNLVLKATYSLLTYTITYELDEGTYLNAITTYTILDNVVFGEVIKEKHIFEGFKLQSIQGEYISEIQPGSLTENITVYSIFTRIYDNEWYFIISEPSSEMIEISLYIGGYVNFAGFDAIISYNTDALEIQSINNALGSIINTETIGEIQTVFVDALNVKKSTTFVMKITFDILSDQALNLLLIVSDMITISENFEIIDVEYFIKSVK